MIQNLAHYVTVAGPTHIGQSIAMGPVASQEAIKLLSGDGGGFFNTNSAHPFENPTGLTNGVEALLMLLVPAAMTYTFGPQSVAWTAAKCGAIVAVPTDAPAPPASATSTRGGRPCGIPGGGLATPPPTVSPPGHGRLAILTKSSCGGAES